jgi:Secretion system C-terminal sorting domain
MKHTQRSYTLASLFGNKAIVGTLIVKGLDVATFVTQRARIFFFVAQMVFTLPVLGQQVGTDMTMNLDRYKASDLFLLTLNNKNGNDVIVRITNAHKEVIFEQSIRFAEKIKKVYNLSTLQKGTYLFSVANNSGSSNSVTINTTESFEEYAENGKSILVGFSKVSLKKTISLTIQNKTKQSVTITILDENGKTILQEEIGKIEMIKKEISLSQIPSGAYVIRVGNKDNQFKSSITI